MEERACPHAGLFVFCREISGGACAALHFTQAFAASAAPRVTAAMEAGRVPVSDGVKKKSAWIAILLVWTVGAYAMWSALVPTEPISDLTRVNFERRLADAAAATPGWSVSPTSEAKLLMLTDNVFCRVSFHARGDAVSEMFVTVQNLGRDKDFENAVVRAVLTAMKCIYQGREMAEMRARLVNELSFANHALASGEPALASTDDPPVSFRARYENGLYSLTITGEK